MASGSYGKRMLRAGLERSGPPSKRRRLSPDEDAKFWCKAGLDKSGLEKKFIDHKIGFGVFATKVFEKGSFLLEYVGDRVSMQEAEERESGRKNRHCYVFHYKWNGKKSIDATDVERICKYVNDEQQRSDQCNTVMKLKVFKNYPRLCLFAMRDILPGEEIRYDYGDETVSWRQNPQADEEDDIFDDFDDDPFDLMSTEKTEGEDLE